VEVHLQIQVVPVSILDYYKTSLTKVICEFSKSPQGKEGRAMVHAIGRELGTAEVWVPF
jgi:hypothetical protein